MKVWLEFRRGGRPFPRFVLSAPTFKVSERKELQKQNFTLIVYLLEVEGALIMKDLFIKTFLK